VAAAPVVMAAGRFLGNFLASRSQGAEHGAASVHAVPAQKSEPSTRSVFVPAPVPTKTVSQSAATGSFGTRPAVSLPAQQVPLWVLQPGDC